MSTVRPVHGRAVCAALGLLLAARAGAEATHDPAAALGQALAAAESRLAAGDLEAAERHYHDALFEGWLLLGTVDRLDGRMEEARRAFSRASEFVPDDRRAALALASAQLRVGDAAAAVAVLEPHRGARPDLETTRVLARAQAAAGQPDEALRTLEEGVAAAPDDPEVAFQIANEYLWLKKAAAADRLFARVLEQRPLPLTHVLIGRAYRDAGEYDRARRELRRAIELDPEARRAHYYLATVALADPAAGPDALETAIAEFREELRLTGEDSLVLDQLGTTLLEAGRPEEAAPVLERAVRAEDRAVYVYDLGHAQLAQGRPAEAAASLRRALRLWADQGGGEAELEKIHYQLGRALQRLGDSQEALVHLREARRIAARRTDSTRRVTAVGAPGVAGSRPGPAPPPVAEPSPLAAVPEADRRELAKRVRSALAQTYLNLGVMQTRRQQLAPAAELFETAVELDPEFPGVQYALGVARFNMGELDQATGPLSRALQKDADNAVLRRMLAMAWLKTGAFEKAVPLLKGDPQVRSDPGLRLALGIALANSGHAAEAEEILTQLLAEQGESAELRLALAHVYRALGKTELAERELRAYRRLAGKKPPASP